MKCQWFRIQELVPKALFTDVPEDYLWGLFDNRLLVLLDLFRERYGPAVVNNWANGGKFDQSGFRTEKIGAKLSQHRYGRAADMKFSHVSPEEIRLDIKHNLFVPEQLTCVEEDTETWLHIDVRNHQLPNGKILWVKP